MPARSGRAGAAAGAAAGVAPLRSDVRAAGASVLEAGAAGGAVAGPLEVGVVVVELCGDVNRGPVAEREAARDVACSRWACRTSMPSTITTTSTATKAGG